MQCRARTPCGASEREVFASVCSSVEMQHARRVCPRARVAARDVKRRDTRLATYGTLSPGRENHHQLRGLRGTWRRGTVRGRLVEQGWGASLGYPALVLDPAGASVGVHVFECAELPAHWARLDEFEGDGYVRCVVRIRMEDGDVVDAWMYLGAGEPPPA